LVQTVFLAVLLQVAVDTALGGLLEMVAPEVLAEAVVALRQAVVQVELQQVGKVTLAVLGLLVQIPVLVAVAVLAPLEYLWLEL
jgi:hypothetical protein